MVCQCRSDAGTPPVGSPVKRSTSDTAAVHASPATMYKELKQEADLLEQTVPVPSEEELLTGPFGLDVVPGAHTRTLHHTIDCYRGHPPGTEGVCFGCRRRVAPVFPGGIYEQIRAEMVAVKAELKARERLIADKDAALIMYQKQTQNHERSKQSQQVCHGFRNLALLPRRTFAPTITTCDDKKDDGPLRWRSACMTKRSTSSSGRSRC